MLSLPELVSTAQQVLIGFSIAFIFTVSTCTIIRSMDLSTLPLITRPQKRLSLPSLDRSRWEQARCWKHNAIGLVQQAYIKFPGKLFQVFAPDGPQVFIPPNLMDEIKAFPDNLLHSEHTMFPDPGNQEWITWTKQNLDTNVAKYSAIVKQELAGLFPRQFQRYGDWQPIQVHPKLHKIVSAIASRIFLGHTIATKDGQRGRKNLEWIMATINYPGVLLTAAYLLNFWPRRLQRVAKYMIPHMWVSWIFTRLAARVVEEALQHPANEDAVHGVYEMLPEEKKKDYLFQGRVQLGFVMAGILPTIQVICQALFDLAEHPEYIPMLREEIEKVWGPWNAYKGDILEQFASLKKLDSFMKESMRLHGGGATSFRRKVLQPTTLSDGTFLLPGTFVYFPIHALSHDPSIFPDPDVFDGLRFYKLRQRSQADANKHQFTAIDNHATYFGAGRHACPGRTFADLLAKYILIALVTRYDFKIIEGDSTPRDLHLTGLSFVNPKKMIMIRDRVSRLQQTLG
ncbi:cytochrome P450 [Hyaloscypha sp. PMI_1271]|nr:cytochrome P450 [Hyaloscypha sp. PMI_1271]